MAYLTENMAEVLIVFGLILLAIEILILGFSTFVLFFIGIGFIVSGSLMVMGIVPDTLLNALLITAIVSVVVALVSWKPLKNSQNKVDSKNVTNDMIGYRFTLAEDLNIGSTIGYRYSGIDWQVKAKEPLTLGSEVEIVAIEVGLLTVKQVDYTNGTK